MYRKANEGWSSVQGSKARTKRRPSRQESRVGVVWLCCWGASVLRPCRCGEAGFLPPLYQEKGQDRTSSWVLSQLSKETARAVHYTLQALR